MNYGEYCAILDVRRDYLGITSGADDELFRSLIRATSRDLDYVCGYSPSPRFCPIISTRIYDIPRSDDELWFDAELLSLLTLTNGDGTTIAASDYYLFPANSTPKYSLRLRPSGGAVWRVGNRGESTQVIGVYGIWGNDLDGESMWREADTLGAAINSTATTITLSTSDSLRAGWLLRIDSEYLYCESMSGTSARVVRGVNGSLAAGHGAGTRVEYWYIAPAVAELVIEAVAMRYRQRDNPGIETINLPDGTAVTVPREITAFLIKRARDLGWMKI